MQKIIEQANLNSNIYSENIDTYQVIYDGFLRNDFFPWVFILFFTLNRNNWKRPVTIVLIVHWILRSCGDVIFNFIPLREYIPNHYWPYSTENWYKSAALGNVFWLTGEIIADWYPLLRTKAVTNNNRGRIKYVYVTCILYNIIKVINIYCYFIDYPINLSIMDENGKVVTDFAMFKIRWWIILFIMNIISCAYDISVIVTLRKCIFNKLKECNNLNENSFIAKFKQVSEFRIICSMIASIIFLPIILLFVIYLLNTLKKAQNEPSVPSDETIDYLRRAVLNVNYNLMYIDQILLRIFAERSNSKKPSGSYNYGSSSYYSSTNKSNYSNPSMNISSPVNNKINYNQNYDSSKANLIDNNSDIINMYDNSDSYYKEFMESSMNRKNNKYQDDKNTYNDGFNNNNNNYEIEETSKNNSMKRNNKYQYNTNINSEIEEIHKNNSMKRNNKYQYNTNINSEVEEIYKSNSMKKNNKYQYSTNINPEIEEIHKNNSMKKNNKYQYNTNINPEVEEIYKSNSMKKNNKYQYSTNINPEVEEIYKSNSMKKNNKYQNINSDSYYSKNNDYLNNNDMYYSKNDDYLHNNDMHSLKNNNYLNNNDMYYSKRNDMHYSKNSEMYVDTNKYSRTITPLEKMSSPPPDSLLLKKFGDTLNTAKYKPIVRDERSNKYINTKPLDGYYFNNNNKYTTFY